MLCNEVSLKPFGDLHPKNQHGKHHINQTTNLGVPKSHQPLRRLWHWQQPLSAALLHPKLFPFPSQQQGQGPACAKAVVCPWLRWEVPGLLLWAALHRSQPTQGCSTSERPPAPAAHSSPPKCLPPSLAASCPAHRWTLSGWAAPADSFSLLASARHGELHIPVAHHLPCAQRCPERAGSNAGGFAATAREGHRLQGSRQRQVDPTPGLSSCSSFLTTRLMTHSRSSPFTGCTPSLFSALRRDDIGGSALHL